MAHPSLAVINHIIPAAIIRGYQSRYITAIQNGDLSDASGSQRGREKGSLQKAAPVS
jgi:hypothetical protein